MEGSFTPHDSGSLKCLNRLNSLEPSVEQQLSSSRAGSHRTARVQGDLQLFTEAREAIPARVTGTGAAAPSPGACGPAECGQRGMQPARCIYRGEGTHLFEPGAAGRAAHLLSHLSEAGRAHSAQAVPRDAVGAQRRV